MADVVIICLKDKQDLAQRLREAITRAGYSVRSSDSPQQGEAPAESAAQRIEAASAAIVLWSRTSVTSEAVRAVASEARRQGKLIEVSADGLKPMGTVDDSRIALISGWRGEPFHPGWQKLLGELKRLCGPQKAVAAQPAAPPSERRARSPKAGSSGAGKLAALLIAILLLAVGAIAASGWIKDSLRQEPEKAPAVAAPRAAPAPQPVEQPVSAQPVAQPALPPPPLEERPIEPPAPAPKQSGDSAPAANRRTASAPPRATMQLFCERAGRSTRECREFRRQAGKAAPAAREKPKRREQRVKYRYSENMRLFCEGAGRGTPECRLFRRRARTGD